MYRRSMRSGGILLACVCALTLAAAPAAMGQNLLYNPGFEDLNSDTTFGDGWGKFGAADFNDFWSGNPHASFFSDNVGNWGGVFQAGLVGTPGVEYQFDLLDCRLEENIDADYYFGIEFFEGDDSTKIGAAETLMDLSTTGDGLTFSMSGVAPAGTVFIRPIIRYENTRSTAAGQENMFVFNTSLTVIPEPGTLALLAIGALVTLRRRRA